MSPFSSVSHDDGTALLVVLGNTELHDGSLARDSQLLVDLVLNWETVSIPAETALDVEALHGPITGDNILDGRGKKMAVMRKTGSERRTVVESVARATFR